MSAWHMLSPELPPDCGGVGDYAAQVASGLAQTGQGPITVWAPSSARQWEGAPGVEVQSLPDRFGPLSTRMLATRLDADAANARLLVQYVPNVFGRRGANLAFCRWLRDRHAIGQDVRVMFHEPYLYFRWRPDHLAVAIAQRAMAAVMLRASAQVYVSTSTWGRYLEPYGQAARRAIALPIPSAIPFVEDSGAVAARRVAVGARGRIVGHFGSYGAHVAPRLARALTTILAQARTATALCAGDGGDRFAADLIRSERSLEGRVHGRGRATGRDISIDLQACDLLLQPYPDGVTTRRTSVMAGLSNRRPVLTTDGPLTEHVWRSTGAVACVPAGDAQAFAAAALRLLDDTAERGALAARGRATYAERFDLAHTIAALLAPVHAHV